MYFSSDQALDTNDMTLLRSVLDELCADRHIAVKSAQGEQCAVQLIALWHGGFRSADELRSMLKPL